MRPIIYNWTYLWHWPHLLCSNKGKQANSSAPVLNPLCKLTERDQCVVRQWSTINTGHWSVWTGLLWDAGRWRERMLRAGWAPQDQWHAFIHDPQGHYLGEIISICTHVLRGYIMHLLSAACSLHYLSADLCQTQIWFQVWYILNFRGGIIASEGEMGLSFSTIRSVSLAFSSGPYIDYHWFYFFFLWLYSHIIS